MAQRPPGKSLAGFWEFPGGKVEPGESEISALHRELHEELELLVQVHSHLGLFPHTYDWGHVNLSVYVVEPKGIPNPSEDVQVFRWETIHGVSESELAPADVLPWRTFRQRFETTG